MRTNTKKPPQIQSLSARPIQALCKCLAAHGAADGALALRRAAARPRVCSWASQTRPVGSPAGSSRALVARLMAVEARSRAETRVVAAAAAAATTTALQLRMRTRLVCASRDEERALSPAFGSPARAARMLSLRVRSHPARALATRALSLPALAARSRRALSLSPHARSRCPRSRRPQVLSARALATRVFSSPALAACSRRPPALAVRMLCHARRSAGAAGLELALHHRPFTAQHAQSCHARSGPGEGYPAPPSRATPKRHSYVAPIGLRRMLGVVM